MKSEAVKQIAPQLAWLKSQAMQKSPAQSRTMRELALARALETLRQAESKIHIVPPPAVEVPEPEAIIGKLSQRELDLQHEIFSSRAKANVEAARGKKINAEKKVNYHLNVRGTYIAYVDPETGECCRGRVMAVNSAKSVDVAFEDDRIGIVDSESDVYRCLLKSDGNWYLRGTQTRVFKTRKNYIHKTPKDLSRASRVRRNARKDYEQVVTRPYSKIERFAGSFLGSPSLDGRTNRIVYVRVEFRNKRDLEMFLCNAGEHVTSYKSSSIPSRSYAETSTGFRVYRTGYVELAR